MVIVNDAEQMMSLPTLTLNLRLPDPKWVAVRGQDGMATNMDEYHKDFNVEVEVVQLNLNTGGMRVRFNWPDANAKKGVSVKSMDVSIEHFYNRFDIVKK